MLLFLQINLKRIVSPSKCFNLCESGEHCAKCGLLLGMATMPSSYLHSWLFSGLFLQGHSSPAIGTIFLRSDAAATIYFAAHFVRLLFEGGYYSRAASISLESLETSTKAR